MELTKKDYENLEEFIEADRLEKQRLKDEKLAKDTKTVRVLDYIISALLLYTLTYILSISS